jgi:CheY-like chemotaxis protein
VIDPDHPVRHLHPILVVEDDERLHQLTTKRLKLIGFQVLEAHDEPSALEILWRGDHVDLVFTDLIMPAGSPDGKSRSAPARCTRE